MGEPQVTGIRPIAEIDSVRAEALHDALGVISLVSIRLLTGEPITQEELFRQIGAEDLDDFSRRMVRADVALKTVIADISAEPYSPRFLRGNSI